MSFTETKKCRICGGTHLNVCLDLGVQYLSGIFPRVASKKMPHAPLKLLQCDPEAGGCGHIQLSGTYSLDMMYGENYGYRSGSQHGPSAGWNADWNIIGESNWRHHQHERK